MYTPQPGDILNKGNQVIRVDDIINGEVYYAKIGVGLMRTPIDIFVQGVEGAQPQITTAKVRAEQAEAAATAYKGELELTAELLGADSPATIRDTIRDLQSQLAAAAERERVLVERLEQIETAAGEAIDGWSDADEPTPFDTAMARLSIALHPEMLGTALTEHLTADRSNAQ